MRRIRGCHSSSPFHSLLLWLLFLIAVIDARTKAIPDVLTVTFLLGSLFHAAIARNIDLLGIGLGGGWFAVQWIGSRGKWIRSGDLLIEYETRDLLMVEYVAQHSVYV